MYKQIIIYALIMVYAISCTPGEDSISTKINTDEIKIIYPTDITIYSIIDETMIFENRSNGEKYEINTQKPEVDLPNGLYDCNYTANVKYQNGTITSEGQLQGKISSLELNGKETQVQITTYLTIPQEDFIIQEIFFTGTQQPTGSMYLGDTYIKIINNTNRVLYADGLAIAESKFTSSNIYEYNPNLLSTTFSVQTIYRIPGQGTEHPVAPGESLLLCDIGINHKTNNPNSFDLSKADFEWYDVSTSASLLDINSETVPDLDKWYCYSPTVWIIHNRGFHSYALIRIPIDKREYLNNYEYDYSYTRHNEQGDFENSQTAYKIPYEWIVDGVNCSTQSERKWDILPASIDAGWTHCGTTQNDPTRYFKCIRRKLLYIDENGRAIYKDTNNSSNDFNTEVTPSLIEEQHSAIDKDGTKANIITYDGITPKQ